ncbi:hypothetical protein [Mycobacterium intracellulare]|uniref:Uncharacterized protein n=1 Tax=Mycobacterium paraffinicum TaxID=53378 RepID=A0A1Q4HPB5_9MYCO|nr:hypothetical protein [Mycobacterium intracellulare]OCB23504.1 hypothetical protein A5689_15410 [Mycobacterium intracellulare subsp. yongonense]OJZ69434.1 hypothetical protein BRW65_22750 [Mycobacterium paraffinicum]
MRRKKTVSAAVPTPMMAGARHVFWLNPDDRQIRQARFRVRRPDNTAGPSAVFSVTVESTKTVVTQRGSDESGFLSFVLQTDTTTMTGTFTFTRVRIVGTKVVDALPSIELLQDFRAPNVLQVSWASGEFVDFQELPPSDEVFPESVMEYLRALTRLQAYAAAPVVIPDLTRVSAGDARAVKDAARLVAGETVDGEWEAFRMPAGAAVDLKAYYELIIVEPLIVTVGAHTYTLGAMHTRLPSVRFVVEDGRLRAEPFLNDTMRRVFAPEEPVPERSHRPVKGRPIGLIDNPEAPAGPETLPERDSAAVLEALRARVLVDALTEPVSLRLVLWHAVDESPFATREQAWADAAAAVRSLAADGLVTLTEQTSGDSPAPAVDAERPEAVLDAVTEQIARGERPAWTTGPWLILTSDGQQVAAQLAPRPERPPARRRRRLHAAAAGRSGHRDSSERVDEILANEVWN